MNLLIPDELRNKEFVMEVTSSSVLDIIANIIYINGLSFNGEHTYQGILRECKYKYAQISNDYGTNEIGFRFNLYFEETGIARMTYYKGNYYATISLPYFLAMTNPLGISTKSLTMQQKRLLREVAKDVQN